jgi:translation initiation factor 3 subunit D
MCADFLLPAVPDNPTGWGPCAVPDQFKHMPYQPFSKCDRLGKVSDWTGGGMNPGGQTSYSDKKYANKYTSQYAAAGAGQYSYYHEHDDRFQVVDTIKPARTSYFRGRGRGGSMGFRGRGGRGGYPQRGGQNQQNNQQGYQQSWQQRGGTAGRGFQQRGGKNNQRGRGGRWNNYNRTNVSRKSSVEVKADWDEVESLDFSRLTKLKLPDVSPPEDLYTAGRMDYYDRKWDKVNTNSEIRLSEVNRRFFTVTTTDDPIMRKLAPKFGTVFATDVILATLMCCTRSVNSWDIVATKIKGKIFLDKREDSSAFDSLTVNETAYDAPTQDLADAKNAKVLSDEATHINYCLSQQVLKHSETAFDLNNENPFLEDDEDEEEAAASVGYRYRMWKLGEGVSLVCRTEHDAVLGPTASSAASGSTAPQFLNIKALNEFESKSEWRQKLDIQSGAVLATELKNNSFKMAKWCISAYLAGSDLLKLGFVSRVNHKDNKSHEILKMQTFVPQELSTQINLNVDNCWGILRAVVDIINRQEEDEGKFVIMKDPNKNTLRIYKVPQDTFSSDDEEEDDDDEGPGIVSISEDKDKEAAAAS